MSLPMSNDPEWLKKMAEKEDNGPLSVGGLFIRFLTEAGCLEVKADQVLSLLKKYPLEVVVVVEGGVIQNVDVPPGVIVETRDFDTEGCPETDVKIDDNGDSYVEGIWESPKD